MRDTCFLLGAGASVEAKLPTMKQLHDDFLVTYQTPDLVTKLAAFVNAPDNTFPKQIEGLLTYLNQTAANNDDAQTRRDATIIGYDIKKFILRNISRPPATAGYLDGLHEFLNDPPADIFSLNYDTVIETWCDKEGVSYTDGFTRNGNWDDQLLRENYTSIRLWKLHGSITWEQHEDTLRRTRPLGTLREELRTGELRARTFDALIIYPAAQKKAERILKWLQDAFADRLHTLDTLVAIGYSFADDHINNHIAQALQHNPRLHVLICTPDPTWPTDNLKRTVAPSHHDRLHPQARRASELLTPGTLTRIINSMTRPAASAASTGWAPPPYQLTITRPARVTVTTPNMAGTRIVAHPCTKVAIHEDTIALLNKSATTWTLSMTQYPRPTTPQTVCDGFHDPRGIAITRDSAYIVDATIHGRLMGLGGIWRVDLTTGKMTMLVGRPRTKGLLALVRRRTTDLAPLSVLRWPTSIMVHDDQHLLVTESRRVISINPQSGEITPVTPAAFLNLNGISPCNDTEVLVFEHVLSNTRAPGSGAGTLWSIDLAAKTAPRVIAGGFTNARGVAVNRDRTTAYVGEVQAGGHWQLVSVDLATGTIAHLAGEYSGKPAFTMTTDDELLICTPDGLYQRRPI